MDPWSKGDYSQLIWDSSMVVERLPVVILPSGRVPGRVLLVLPILEARRRRNRDEIAKRVPPSRVSGDALNICQRGASEEPLGAQAPPPRRGPGGARRQGAWSPGAPPLLSFGRRVVSGTLIFYIIFLDFSGQFSKRENLKYKNSRKQKLALGCTELIG